MSERSRITPADEDTGVPLPIISRHELPPVPVRGEVNTTRFGDWHHPFHPKTELIVGTPAESALRHSRVQWTRYDDHHYRYHPAYDGPLFPVDDDDIFTTVAFAAAGYIPADGISFDRYDRPIRLRVTDVQRERFWDNGEIRVASLPPVRTYLTSYTLRHDFGGISEKTIDEFLNTADKERRQGLGRDLLALAAYDAGTRLHDQYRRLYKAQQIPPQQARKAGRFIFDVIHTQAPMQGIRTLTKQLMIPVRTLAA